MQSWLAIVVVLGTMAVFASRLFRKKKKAGGCSSCGGGSGAVPKAKVH